MIMKFVLLFFLLFFFVCTRHAQTSDNQSKCNDVWSDGRKTEPSSASPVRKRLNRSQTEGAVPVRASAGPRRRNAAMRYESRRESDEQDESEHETSSSSSDSGASVQSGQSVFVPKGAHAKAQLPNKLTVSSSRRPKLSAKLKRRFAK